MIKGLDTYTVKNGLIYLYSLLRSSILYRAEIYCNLTETNTRMIERIEEECLFKILEAGKNCPTSLLYLETGQLPARNQIKTMMQNFLKYILDQKRESLLSKFFTAQCENPTKGDWVSNIKKIMIEVCLEKSFEEIVNMKKKLFKKYVIQKVKNIAFLNLLANVKSKGQEIKYGPELQCQDYLMPNNVLTLPEQRTIFSKRARMKLKYNIKGKNCEEKCKCGQELTTLH